MKEKFTKGEWVSTGVQVGVEDKSDTQSYGMIMSICHIDAYDFPEDWKANAHLIAAAPEMYEELKNLLDPSMHWEDYERIEKLLAKARGE